MSAPQIYQIQALSEAQKQFIKASIPVLELSGVELTKQFYAYMLSTYPEVKPFFNETNQYTFKQPKILAHALLAYAKNIDDITPLTDFVEQIVVKHVGLQIKAEHYPIVGTSLLTTMQKLLGETATPEFLAAWATAYGNLAQILIDAEHAMYQKQEWAGFREFTVTRIENEAQDVKSIYFTPQDNGKISVPLQGQYLGFRFAVPGKEFEQSREYSISEFPQENEYRISVRKLEDGIVSTYIHQQLKVGDTIKVAPPAGRFVYQATKKDVVVFAGGIGITPLVSIVEKALDDGKNVVMFNSNRSPESRPFGAWLDKVSTNEKFSLREFVGKRLSAEDFENVPFADREIYMIGPVEYMAYVRSELEKKGVEKIELEFFSPTNV